jgi:murein DD-endopeptidase MepM/ murein hydrolase activator NlpD
LLLAGALALGAAAHAQTDEPPFGLPFADPPGLDSWLLIQAYGNTTFAYRYRDTVYVDGQGLHFGIDLAARCGTPVVAIGDGVVREVDSAYHGAGPHNVMIDHPNGYASFYGHLLARSTLRVGQEILRGEVLGYSGDPDLTCTSRPHLHLEIRNAPEHVIAYNPLTLIDADWDRILLAGTGGYAMQQDLEDPRHWTDPLDQPPTYFGYPLVNNYAAAWPPDW